MVQRVQCYFDEKEKIEKYTSGILDKPNIGYKAIFPVESKTRNLTVNNTQGTLVLFSQERLRLKITQSKVALTKHRVQCYFSREEEG